MLVESEVRERAYRFVAYSAVTFSLTAIIAVFITLPMVNNYVNSVQSRVQMEMDFCKISAKEVMLEMHDAKDVVFLARQDLLEHPVVPEFLAVQVPQAHRDSQEDRQRSARKSLSHRACRVRQANPDHRGRLVIPAILDPSAILAVQEMTVHRVHKDLLGQMDHRENQAATVRGETLDDLLFRLPRFLATQVHQESRDRLDCRERQENRDGLDPRDNRDRKDRQDHPASRDQPGIREKPANLVTLDHKESVVFGTLLFLMRP
ncbi:cuticle collagen 2 precursor [Aphelenchoides avenae]|nr:cuticle collagen 2 precursor [Aphelenchus avenae]